jgi:hypothetical protein
MGTPPQQSGFYSTPAFELFRRGLNVQTVKRFRGLNAYLPITQLTPDIASDLLNVIISSNGSLSKLMLPIPLSPPLAGVNSGPQGFWDFQQAVGTRQVFAVNDSKVFYYTNDLANVTLIEDNPLNVGTWSVVVANNILFAANGQRMRKWTGTAWQAWGGAAPVGAPILGAVQPGNLSPLLGYTWQYAYKNSVTGHVTTVSPTSNATGAGVNRSYMLTATPPPDPQFDTIVWFRSLDGGGDYFRLAEVVIATGQVTFNAGTVTVVGGSGSMTITDNTPDSNLDLTIRGPLINNPPPLGQYIAVSQGRIFIAGVPGDLSTVYYSGYEQILVGRPEESFPPFNKIRIQIGAESVVGIGVLHAGPVFFSNTGKMWILRGAVEDITLSAPVAFSDVLEELPWTLGCLSHLSIQATPYGLMWLAGDKTVQFWDGRSNPVDVSLPVYPLLRTITAGTEKQSVGMYFNWLERDWYALVCATGGSVTPNTIIFWALQPQAQQIDVFVTSIQANFAGVVSTSKLQRKLLVSNNGVISELPVRGTATSGITTDYTTYPPTNGNLRAYWRSGYFGNDAPQQSKMFRWTRIVGDPGMDSCQVQARFVDDNNTIDAPLIIGPVPLSKFRTALNQRAYRGSIEVDFPEQNGPFHIDELQCAFIATSER